MSEEEYLRKKLDQINMNSHYGIMVDTEITNMVRDHMKELEENTMNATSVQVINEVKDMSVTIEKSPLEETRIIISVSTDDDTYEFNCSGPGCEKFLRKHEFIPIQEYKYINDQLIDREKEIIQLKEENEKYKEAAERRFNEKLNDFEVNNKKYDGKIMEEVFTRIKRNSGRYPWDEEKSPADNVNHPSHYETGKFECIEVMQEIFGVDAVRDFCKCNAFKYVYRMDRKNGTEDVKKASWYLNKYLELTEKED